MSFVLLLAFSIGWGPFNRPLESLLSTLWHCCWLSLLWITWTLSEFGWFSVFQTELVNWWVHDRFSWYLQKSSTITVTVDFVNNISIILRWLKTEKEKEIKKSINFVIYIHAARGQKQPLQRQTTYALLALQPDLHNGWCQESSYQWYNIIMADFVVHLE